MIIGSRPFEDRLLDAGSTFRGHDGTKAIERASGTTDKLKTAVRSGVGTTGTTIQGKKSASFRLQNTNLVSPFEVSLIILAFGMVHQAEH